jgi:hypothetical protein
MSATPYDLSFFAPGVPAPKGSLDAKPIPGSRKVYMRRGEPGEPGPVGERRARRGARAWASRPRAHDRRTYAARSR